MVATGAVHSSADTRQRHPICSVLDNLCELSVQFLLTHFSCRQRISEFGRRYRVHDRIRKR